MDAKKAVYVAITRPEIQCRNEFRTGMLDLIEAQLKDCGKPVPMNKPLQCMQKCDQGWCVDQGDQGKGDATTRTRYITGLSREDIYHIADIMAESLLVDNVRAQQHVYACTYTPYHTMHTRRQCMHTLRNARTHSQTQAFTNTHTY